VGAIVSALKSTLSGLTCPQGHFLAVHARFLLAKGEAEEIIADTKAQVGHWYDTVRACGVSEKDAESIRGAFIYPGFAY
jgi:serine/threonine-protein kinase HipA